MKTLRKRVATQYGIAVRGGTLRGVAALGKGLEHEAVLIWLMDEYNYRVLQIDIETGVCDCIPVPFENPNAVYASLRSRGGRCYSIFGNHFAEYDPLQKRFTFVERVPSLASMAMEEDDKGRIWSITYPDSALYAFDPATGVFTSHGVLKEENWQQYPRSLVAAPDGWLYAGLGMTAGNIIAFHSETHEVRHLFAEDERPRPAMLSVLKGKDGNIYGVHEKRKSFYKLSGGVKTPCPEPDAELFYHDYSGDQNVIIRDFPSGRTLSGIDLDHGVLEILEKDGKTKRSVSFTFENHGAPLMALDVNSDGLVAGGGFFPFHFGTLDPATGRQTDELANIQCNTILAYGKYFYIGGYGGGQFLRYDPSLPWTLETPMKLTEPDLTGNPLFYGKANPLINRPHALVITPDGKTLIMGGTPEYGMTGGSLALLDTESGTFRTIPHTELAENEAPFALAALSNDLLLVGTTISPGTGGEQKAKNASLLLVDLNTRKTVWSSKALGDMGCIVSLMAIPGGAIGIAADFDNKFRFFRFELEERRIIPGVHLNEYGKLPLTQGPRLFHRDGENIWLLFKSGAGKIDPSDGSITEFISITPAIQATGAIRNGVLYYAGGNRWCSVRLAQTEE
ncbi:MAG: hypothetical protein IKD44_07215 [Lentisphaeria bacterium]|nr:hypothetical protein [Lentisphaeria bacterium]